MTAPMGRGPRRAACAVHIRVGDVIERSWIDVDATWAGTSYNRYVRPQCYYEDVIRKLQSSGRHYERIVLVANPRAVWSYVRDRDDVTTNQSAQIIDRVGALFAAAGYAVETRTAGDADCDLIFMSSLGCLVPGGGGFSALAAKLALEAGTVVEGNANCAAPLSANLSRGHVGASVYGNARLHCDGPDGPPVVRMVEVQLVGLHSKAESVINGGKGVLLGNATVTDAAGVDTGRMRVRIQEPSSQAGRVWLLRPSNLRVLPSNASLSVSAVRART